MRLPAAIVVLAGMMPVVLPARAAPAANVPDRATPGSSDWRVRRSPGSAVAEALVQSLIENPHEAGLAARVRDAAAANPRTGGVSAVLERLAALARDPGGYQALAAHAEMLLATGQAAAAARAFESALQLRPRSVHAAAGRALATVAAGTSAGSHEAAQQTLQAALAITENPALRLRLLRAGALLAEQTNNLPVLVAMREGISKALPADASALEEFCDALTRANRRPEANAAIETALAQALARSADPNRERTSRARDSGVGALLELAAKFQIKDGQPSRAFDFLRERLDVAPAIRARDAGFLDRLFEVARLSFRLPELQSIIETRVSNTPHEREADSWRLLVKVRETLGDYPGALIAAKERSRLLPMDRGALEDIARIARSAGDHDRTEGTRHEMTRRWPRDVDLVVDGLLAALQPSKQNSVEPNQVESRFGRALAQFRGDLEALGRLADVAARAGQDAWSLRAFEGMLRINPRSERAIVGLGEIHFQRGRRELARKTWGRLLTTGLPRAHAHAHLAALLADHELLEEAESHARRALTHDPNLTDGYRVLARVAERKKLLSAAIECWEEVLKRANGSQAVFERREARARLLSLFTDEGRGRLNKEAQRIRARMGRAEADREEVIFLSEIEIHANRQEQALDVLQSATTLWPNDAEVVGRLFSMLRRSRRLMAAQDLLEAFVARAPEKTAWAMGQLADLAFERGDLTTAMRYGREAANADPEDENTWLRLAEIEEHIIGPSADGSVEPSGVAAGVGTADSIAVALRSTRRALSIAGSARAAAATARLLQRRGDLVESLALLREQARRQESDTARADLFTQARAPAELLSLTGDLEREIALIASVSGRELGSIHADLLLEILPDLHRRSASDPAAARTLERVGQLGLRTLLDVVAPAPSPARVAALGLLGRKQAAPALVAILGGAMEQPPPDAATELRPHQRRYSGQKLQLANAALIALGRLGVADAGPALLNAAENTDGGARLTALWALGRVVPRSDAASAVDPESAPRPQNDAVAFLLAASDQDGEQMSVLGSLGLGRVGGPGRASHLHRIAGDSLRPVFARRAATLALGRLADREPEENILPALTASFASEHPALARAAAAALAASGQSGALAFLWGRALADAPPRVSFAQDALFAFGAPLPDEQFAIGNGNGNGNGLDGAFDAAVVPGELMNAMEVNLLLGGAGGEGRTGIPPALIEHPQIFHEGLDAVLASETHDRKAALSLILQWLTPSPGDQTDPAEKPQPSPWQHAAAERTRGLLANLASSGPLTERILAVRVLTHLGHAPPLESLLPLLDLFDRVTAQVVLEDVFVALHDGLRAGIGTQSAPAMRTALRARLIGRRWQTRALSARLLLALGLSDGSDLVALRGDPHALVREIARNAAPLPAFSPGSGARRTLY